MEQLGIDLWDEARRAKVEAFQWELGRRLLGLGQTVIIEWGTWGRAERDALRAAARSLGAAVELHYLPASADVLFDRIRQRGREDPPVTLEQVQRWVSGFEAPTSEELAFYDSPSPPAWGLDGRPRSSPRTVWTPRGGCRSGRDRGAVSSPPMRRLLRSAFNLSAAVSLLLLVATWLLWLRSYRVQDHVGSVAVTAYAYHGLAYDGLTYDRRRGLFSAAGRITYSSTALGYTPAEWAMRRVSPPPATTGFGWSTGDFHDFWDERNYEFPLGFGNNGWRTHAYFVPDAYSICAIPYWFIAILVALPPLSWVAWRRRWPVMAPRLLPELYAVLLAWAALMICVTSDSWNPIHLGLLLGLATYLACRNGAPLLRSLEARRQAKSGLCPSCGYDLRATRERCPECGHVPKRA